jgi:hypothetical protein
MNIIDMCEVLSVFTKNSISVLGEDLSSFICYTILA